MRLGIVGSEGKKFTPETEEIAREHIRWCLHDLNPDTDTVVSGGCHLGGIDSYAIEEAEKLGIQTTEHKPAKLVWSGGYKERNLKIVEDSDKVVCITLKELPESYQGMTFNLCYHCGTDTHVKSGGCWTMKQARMVGKDWELIVI